MFEQEPANMISHIYIENDFYNVLTSDRVGFSIDEIQAGSNELSWDKAQELIKKADKLSKSCPKRYLKKLAAFRNGIVSSFGPDLVYVVGWLQI